MSSDEESEIDESYPSLALLIRTGRRDAQLSIRELARRADVPASQISRVERDQILSPASGFLIAIARALGKPPEPLLYLAGLITDDEFDSLTAEWRVMWENVQTAIDLVDWAIKEGNRELAAQSAFFGPGAAETAVSLLSLGGQQDERDLRDLLAMWPSLTPERRKALLLVASDHERLSRADRRDAEPGRYEFTLDLRER